MAPFYTSRVRCFLGCPVCSHLVRKMLLALTRFFRRTKQGQLTEEEKERKNKDLRKSRGCTGLCKVAIWA